MSFTHDVVVDVEPGVLSVFGAAPQEVELEVLESTLLWYLDLKAKSFETKRWASRCLRSLGRAVINQLPLVWKVMAHDIFVEHFFDGQAKLLPEVNVRLLG